MAFITPFPNHFPKCSSPLLCVLGHKKPVCGARVFLSLGEVANNLGVSSFGLMGADRVGSGTRVALCDHIGGSRKEGQCPRSVLPETIWGPNSTARQGLLPLGPSVGGRAEPPRGPRAALGRAPRPHPTPRPHPAPLQPSSGRAPALWDGLTGDGAGAGEEAAFLQIT